MAGKQTGRTMISKNALCVRAEEQVPPPTHSPLMVISPTGRIIEVAGMNFMTDGSLKKAECSVIVIAESDYSCVSKQLGLAKRSKYARET